MIQIQRRASRRISMAHARVRAPQQCYMMLRMQSIDSVSRRTFLAATSAMALARGASSKDRLKAVLGGCVGRGPPAAVNLLTGSDNVEIEALADLFQGNLHASVHKL